MTLDYELFGLTKLKSIFCYFRSTMRETSLCCVRWFLPEASVGLEGSSSPPIEFLSGQMMAKLTCIDFQQSMWSYYKLKINLGYFYVNSYYDLLVNWYLLISLNCRRWHISKYPYHLTKQYHLSELWLIKILLRQRNHIFCKVRCKIASFKSIWT